MATTRTVRENFGFGRKVRNHWLSKSTCLDEVAKTMESLRFKYTKLKDFINKNMTGEVPLEMQASVGLLILKLEALT